MYALDINRSESNIQEFASLGAQRFAAIQSQVSPLGTLAAETDGELFTYASRRLDEVLDRIAGRAGDYYIVAFEPAEGETADPADYRRVEVTVSRPGARVSTRTGYAVGSAPTAADRRQAIDAAVAAPYALQGLPLEYTTYVLRGDTPDAPRVVLSLEAELPVAAARESAAADVVFVVRDARTGQAVASGTDVIALPAAPSPGTASGRGTYQVQFETPPGSYLMRAVVREPGGQIGSADRRFEVRAVGGPGVSASDLLMGSTTEPLPVRATAFTEDGLSGIVELYGDPAALEEVDVQLRLLAPSDVETATTVSADLLEINGAGTDAKRTARMELPLAGVAPGRYLAHVDVRRAGETIGQLRRELDVVAGSRPAREPERAAVVDASEILRGQLAATYLTALGDVTADDPLAEALARARSDDWPGVDALLSDPAGASAGDAGVIELALRGLARFGVRDYGGAATALEAAFAADTDAPRQARTGFFLGWAYAYQGDDRQAASAWRRAVFLDAALVPAHLALADAYLRMSQPALAAQVLEAGLGGVARLARAARPPLATGALTLPWNEWCPPARTRSGRRGCEEPRVSPARFARLPDRNRLAGHSGRAAGAAAVHGRRRARAPRHTGDRRRRASHPRPQARGGRGHGGRGPPPCDVPAARARAGGIVRRGGPPDHRRRCLHQPGRSARTAVRIGLRRVAHGAAARSARAPRRRAVPPHAFPSWRSRGAFRTPRPQRADQLHGRRQPGNRPVGEAHGQPGPAYLHQSRSDAAGRGLRDPPRQPQDAPARHAAAERRVGRAFSDHRDGRSGRRPVGRLAGRLGDAPVSRHACRPPACPAAHRRAQGSHPAVAGILRRQHRA